MAHVDTDEYRARGREWKARCTDCGREWWLRRSEGDTRPSGDEMGHRQDVRWAVVEGEPCDCPEREVAELLAALQEQARRKWESLAPVPDAGWWVEYPGHPLHGSPVPPGCRYETDRHGRLWVYRPDPDGGLEYFIAAASGGVPGDKR